MKYNPRLKKAMNEINDILNNYDINASIVLHSPGFGEHFMKVDASFSCAKIEDTIQGPMVRIKAKKEDVKRIEDTVNSIVIMNELISMHKDVCYHVMKSLGEKIDWDNSGGTHTTNQEINN